MNLVDDMFVLHRFQTERFAYEEWPKHQKYILFWSDFKIAISEETELIRFSSHVPRGLRVYPLVPSIKFLTDDNMSTKMIIGAYKWSQ
jgi:hypothetical protein